MTTTRWNPFRDMEDMLERYNRVYGRPQPHRDAAQEGLTVADWTPAVDISETAQEYLIKVELPEVSKEDVKISVHGGVLTLQGERRPEREEGRKYHRVERSYGTFARSFTLPEDVDEENIRAEQREGVLYLRLVKAAKPKPRSIEVQVS